MNKRKIALGPGAASLILIVVVLSLCMLAMLAQIGSRNDLSLSSRSAEMITRVYELRDQSEHRMAELDAILVHCQADAGDRDAYLALVEKNLPEDMTLDEDVVNRACGRKLIVTVEEHSVVGGLGSAVAERIACCVRHPRLLMMGHEGRYPLAGSYGDLIRQDGLDAESIYKKVIQHLKEKT